MSDLDLLVHRVRPARAAEPDGLLVLFHGRGADENDLFPLFDILDPDGSFVGVTPRGPLSLPPGGAHWYVTRRVGYPDPPTFRDTFDIASQWLDALGAGTGLPPGKTIIGGFSQGAVMSYALSLGTGRPRPAGTTAFSGFIPRVDGFELNLSDLAGWPVAIGHGIYDPVITVDWGRDARARLAEAGADVTYRESEMPHSIDPEYLSELRPWVSDALRRAAAPKT